MSELAAIMNKFWKSHKPGTGLIVCGPGVYRMARKEWAASDAESKWTGHNWRRIKREMNKARKATN